MLHDYKNIAKIKKVQTATAKASTPLSLQGGSGLEPEPEEHSNPPFVSSHLQMVLVSSHRIVVYSRGSGKLVAP